MVGTARPIDPAGHGPGVLASEMVLEATGGDERELQRKLWVAAKRSPGREAQGEDRPQSCGDDIRVVIADVNPILRGWGNYFRTGNPATKFIQIDRYVERRLGGLMRKRYGRHLRAGQWEVWTRGWFEAHGLYRLRGTVRYPVVAS